MSDTQNPSGTTGNPPKSVLMKEFEKLRRETAGINSLFQNKTAGNSTGLVSNSILLEIRDMIGKVVEKQEKLEEKIEKIDEKVEKLKEESLENRKVQIEIKEQLNQKIEGVHKDLDIKIQNTLEKLENSKENQEKNPKINEKAEISSVDIPRRWTKFGQPLPVRSPRSPALNSSEYIDIQLKYERSVVASPAHVKTTDKISILDRVPKMFGFPSPEYYIKDQNGEVKRLNRNSTFAHLNIKNGDVISYGLIQ